MSKINKKHRVIWTNNDFEEWREAVIKYDGYSEEDANYDTYCEDCDNAIWDERTNLNVPVDGVIVGFADLGLWNGRRNGAKIFGSNVKDILYSSDDYLDWYCDQYNVRCTGIHHDGTNHYLYRVAKDEEQAERLVYAIAYEGMTEEQFRKRTKSLRPYVAGVYGF